MTVHKHDGTNLAVRGLDSGARQGGRIPQSACQPRYGLAGPAAACHAACLARCQQRQVLLQQGRQRPCTDTVQQPATADQIVPYSTRKHGPRTLDQPSEALPALQSLLWRASPGSVCGLPAAAGAAAPMH